MCIRRCRSTKNNTKLESSWKRPNTNFWIKQRTATRRHIAAIFNKLIEEDKNTGVVNGRSNLSYTKNENTENPKNYRPVTCLPTMYKLITSVISRRMQKYVDDENLIPK